MLRGVLRQVPQAYFYVAELPLDHPERVFSLGPHLRLGLLDRASHPVQHMAFAVFLVGAAPGRYLPDDRPSL
ncbi:hypothetical protein D3C76_882100 [compost metagenome]